MNQANPQGNKRVARSLNGASDTRQTPMRQNAFSSREGTAYCNGNGHVQTHGNGHKQDFGSSYSHPLVSGGGSASVAGAEAVARPRNRLLASLPRPLWERLAPYIRHALLIPGQVLVESKNPTERVYFPNSGLISLAMVTRDGAQVEIGMVGREGTTCTLETLISAAPACRSLVQIAGNACWLPLSLMRSEFNSDAALRDWLLNYWNVLNVQTAQSALCNRLHSVEERLSRWLLLVRDRIGSDEIEITHEFIAHTLGARRSGVTVALGALQQSELIDCTRGKITILDAERLRTCACECYTVLHEHFSHFETAQRQAIESGASPDATSAANLLLLNASPVPGRPACSPLDIMSS